MNRLPDEILDNHDLNQRFLGIRFFIDWLTANHENYNFFDPYVDDKLLEDYLKYWQSI